ncbi:MAG: hypothetical protein MUO57_15545 [Anaerolineales bacterium]|nr:hypothetical protein [Anaerolineales bacterium]
MVGGIQRDPAARGIGRITILRQVAYLAYHEQTHLPEIEALRERFG